MKKLIIPSVLMFGLALFSFTSPSDGGVKKIGKKLYEVKTEARFSEADAKAINALIVKEYKLTDTQLKMAQTEGIELDFLNKGFIIRKKFTFMGMIDDTFIKWDNSEMEISEQAERVVNILDSYVNK